MHKKSDFNFQKMYKIHKPEVENEIKTEKERWHCVVNKAIQKNARLKTISLKINKF